jgi:hypothetical protein
MWEKIETGPKGARVTFRDNTFANPDRLVAFIRDLGRADAARYEGGLLRRLGRSQGEPRPFSATW